ncbi:unnamed protein product [Leptosia nina]|uniref:Uncharacterized protein n=1 Tax=Leptosia nina TaxID=320188 RepID=A0AAV1JUM8_9NEOP
MENSKTKKGKTTHTRYPAPYSWSHTGSYERKTMRKSASSYETQRKMKFCKPKGPTTGCDPYASHLKYGIFPRRSKEADESKLRLNKTPSVHQSGQTPNIGQSDEPYFIIRPLDKRFTRQLCVSETWHVDIQPRLKSPIRASSSFRFNKRN